MSSVEKLMEGVFQLKLADNEKTLDLILEDSADLQKRSFRYHDRSAASGVCYYVDGLADPMMIETVLRSFMVFGSQTGEEFLKASSPAEQIRSRLVISSSVSGSTRIRDGIQAILSGDALILLDGMSEALVVGVRGWKDRSIEEPATETVTRGPRDGFTENIRTNTALIRRRIRDPQLRVESMLIGRRTQTEVNLVYIQGVVEDGLVKEVRRRLKSIEINGVLESGYIEELIEDAPYSPVNTIQNTERPDKAAAAILEGRIAILIDNTPFILIVPTLFWEYMQASDDYYSRYWVGSFYRLIRYVAFVISMTFPSIYVMLVSFHHEMIPTALALTIASGREVVPFPVLLEALFLELAFELMREAGLRMPKTIGQAVSIVGSLIIGQAAVQAGLVSPFMVIVVALTGISSFVIPSYDTSLAVRLLRFPLLIASGFYGLLGFAVVSSVYMLHALSLRSFGIPFLAPVAPYRPSDLKDLFIRAPWWKMNLQPGNTGEHARQADGQKPEPPPPGNRE